MKLRYGSYAILAVLAVIPTLFGLGGWQYVTLTSLVGAGVLVYELITSGRTNKEDLELQRVLFTSQYDTLTARVDTLNQALDQLNRAQADADKQLADRLQKAENVIGALNASAQRTNPTSVLAAIASAAQGKR